MMADKGLIGSVIHYFGKINVAIIELDKDLAVGDQIHILGSTTDLVQSVDSMQIDHEAVDSAASGSEVAIKVAKRVRQGDQVFQANDSA